MERPIRDCEIVTSPSPPLEVARTWSNPSLQKAGPFQLTPFDYLYHVFCLSSFVSCGGTVPRPHPVPTGGVRRPHLRGGRGTHPMRPRRRAEGPRRALGRVHPRPPRVGQRPYPCRDFRTVSMDNRLCASTRVLNFLFLSCFIFFSLSRKVKRTRKIAPFLNELGSQRFALNQVRIAI